MKHLYLINNNSGRGSMYGIGTYIKQLLKCLKRSEIWITVINIDSPLEKLSTSKENKVRTINIPSSHPLLLEKNQERYLKYISFLLTYYIDNNESNIFHFNYLQANELALRLKQLYPDCHILLTLHCLPWLMELNGNIENLKSILLKEDCSRTFSEKWIISKYQQNIALFHCMDKIVCLAKYTQSLLCEQLKIASDKVETIYNGLEDNKFTFTESQYNELRTKYRINSFERIILFVGRVDKQKGIEALIDAFKITSQSIPNARLIIVGEGDYQLCLEKGDFFWTKITFTGKISQDIIEQLYQIADVGALPSFCEQCSYTAIEMMMNGLPFIGTSSTGLKEMLDDRPKDIIQLRTLPNEVILPVDKLAQRLVYHLSHPKRTNKGMYYKRYSLEQMKSKMIRLYSTL